MKPIIRISAIIGFLSTMIFQAEGQYLEVSRSANIKLHHDVNSITIEKADKGDRYELLLPAHDSTGSYYKVKLNAPPGEGWIYRTLVRRFNGPMPNYIITPEKDLQIEVLDVGQSLCNIIKLPDGRYIIYDAGNYSSNGKISLQQVEKIIPGGSPVELMILSHTDADHIGAAGNIIANYRVKKVVHTGYEQSLVFEGAKRTSAYKRFVDSLTLCYPIEEVNLFADDSVIKPGLTEQFGDVRLIYLAGFPKPLKEWNLSKKDEMINSVSIVCKLIYGGKSVLLCGDAVGRPRGGQEDALIAEEKYLVEKAPELLNSDILVAPHHGADNANSLAFIRKVSPDYVIFSAGHSVYDHPRKSTAMRYLNFVSTERILRTDRGDDDGPDEWDYLRIPGCVDIYGDDNIEIVISSDGNYSVKYLDPQEDIADTGD